MKKLLALFILALLPLPAFADGGISDGVTPLNPGVIYPFVVCDQTARITAVSATAIVIAHIAGKTTYICGYSFGISLVISASAQLVWGTGTTCGTTTVSASPVLADSSTITGETTPTVSFAAAIGFIDSSPASGTSDYCVKIASSAVTNGIVNYAQF